MAKMSYIEPVSHLKFHFHICKLSLAPVLAWITTDFLTGLFALQLLPFKPDFTCPPEVM